MSTIYDWLKQHNVEVEPNLDIETAFVHSSFVNENKTYSVDNERLEFIGDAVLQIYTSTRLYHMEPELSEGQMTLFRSRLVSEPALANYVRQLGLAQYLKLGVGEEKSGGRERDSILADLFEALLGALYLTCGLDKVFTFLDSFLGNNINDSRNFLVEDFKTRLQEYIQADTRKTVEYEVINVTGPSNAPTFEVVVKLDDIVLGKGKGSSKKRAEQDAAKNALHKIAR